MQAPIICLHLRKTKQESPVPATSENEEGNKTLPATSARKTGLCQTDSSAVIQIYQFRSINNVCLLRREPLKMYLTAGIYRLRVADMYKLFMYL